MSKILYFLSSDDRTESAGLAVFKRRDKSQSRVDPWKHENPDVESQKPSTRASELAIQRTFSRYHIADSHRDDPL